MIELLFELGGETILVVIQGKTVNFGSTVYGAQLADISGIHLSKEGVINEFPDLKDKKDWKEQAIGRFKKHISELKNEEAISDYLIEDFKKYGYIPKVKKRRGYRPENIK